MDLSSSVWTRLTLRKPLMTRMIETENPREVRWILVRQTAIAKAHTLIRQVVRIVIAACALVSPLITFCFGPPAFGQGQYRLESGQWIKQSAVDPNTPKGQLLAIRRALAEDQPEQAQQLVEQWLTTYPEHPLTVQAFMLRADSQVAMREYYKALYDYEHVIRYYPASEQFATALEREYEIATLFASGVKRRFLGMRILSAAGEAEEIFIRIQERSPGSQIGQMASLALGDFYFDRAQMTSAAEAYDLFLTNYPNSPYIERALLGLIRSNFATFKGPEFDPTGLIEAAQRIKTLQQQFPASAERIGADALLVRIDESLAIKMLYSAQWYEKRGQKQAAIYIYQRVVRDYSQTAAAGTSIKRLTELAAAVTLSDQNKDGHTTDTPTERQPAHPEGGS